MAGWDKQDEKGGEQIEKRTDIQPITLIIETNQS